MLKSWLAKWALLLPQYDMKFVPWKTIKVQVIANFLAGHPIPKKSKLYEAIPDEAMIVNTTPKEEIW